MKNKQNQTPRKITVGNKTYLLSSNFVPNDETKQLLLAIVRRLIDEEAEKFREN